MLEIAQLYTHKPKVKVVDGNWYSSDTDQEITFFFKLANNKFFDEEPTL